MNFYQYEARDKSGSLIKGTVQAVSPQDVQTDLTNKGLRLVKIEPLGSGGTARPISGPILDPPPSMPVLRQQPSPAVRSGVSPVPPGSVSQSTPAPPLPTQVVRTKRGTDKQRSFLFSQLASAFKAGLNAANAFMEVSQRSAAQFSESLRYASSATSQGVAISEVFARYPDLYPEHVVGLTRAGEAAGFLPEAFDEIARQAETAHSFRRWFFWVWVLVVNFVLSVPAMKVTTDAVMRDWNELNRTGGAGSGGGAMPIGEGLSLFFRQMLLAFLWPWGPITVAAYALIWIGNRWFASMRSQRFRHSLGLKIPVYGKRAWQENLARFSWTMSKVSKAGISPARSWQLSADSVPNLTFREELLRIGTGLAGHEKMSDLFFRSKLFPQEYAPMVASAEYTGDLSGALERLSQISAGEFVAAQNYAKARSGCWGLLGCFITSALLIGMLLYTLDVAIPHQIMNETDQP